jgi:EAL domain-containing protein (putative c-di-GMP-specific phosphodiesterase class I)
MAERAGVSRELTHRILNAAVRACASWRARGWDLAVAVNLSVNDLRTPELGDRVREVLGAWDFPARRLELEITESAMMADPGDAHRVLSELRALGIRIAVDDYGTGYSSLSYLKELPVDVLKIDKSFITDLAKDPHNQAIVRSTVDLGHSLGLEVVAEGVENEEELALLTRWHCERAQGFHLGPPLPAEAFLRTAGPIGRPASA